MTRSLIAIPMVLSILAIGRLTPVLFQQALGQTSLANSLAQDADQGWPRTIVDGTTTFTIYQPQVDRWEGNQLNAYAAVEVTAAASKTREYGVISFTARTAVDKANRLVRLDDHHITKTDFPGDSEAAKTYEQMLQKDCEGHVRIIALDRLEANLAMTREHEADSNQQFKNDPPRIIFSKTPAILVPVDGTAELRPVPGQGNLMHVINTRALILFDNDTSAFSLYTLGGWFTSKSLDGPWSFASQVPENYNLTRDMLIANKAVDVLSAGSAGAVPPAKSASNPAIYVKQR